MNEEVEIVLRGISHTGYTTELERDNARYLIEKLYKENQQLKEKLEQVEKANKEAINYFYNLENYGKESISKNAKLKLLYILDTDKGE